MNFMPLPDLALNRLQQSQVSNLRAELQTASQELTTGLSADPAAKLNGNLAPLLAIDRSLALSDQRIADLSLASNKAGFAQAQLSTLSDLADRTGLDLISAVSSGDVVSTNAIAGQARTALDTVFGTLNATYAGRSLFSGAAEDRPALTGVDQLVADVAAIIDAGPTPADAEAAIEVYFNDPTGGFSTTIYAGSTSAAPSVALDDQARLAFLPRADDQSVRDLLRGLATTAAVASGAGAADPSNQSALLEQAGRQVFSAKTAIVALKAELGVSEEKLDESLGFQTSLSQTLEMSRNDLVAVDPYAAATRFTALEGQLASLYTVTARLSGLRLTNFL